MNLKLLNAPFPFLHKTKHKLWTAISFGLFVTVFLFVFRPFQIERVAVKQPEYIFGYGLITFFVLVVFLFLLPQLLPKQFNVDRWTVLKTLTFILFQLCVISIFNWYFTIVISEVAPTINHSLFDFFFITLSVGVFPTVILVLFLERLLREGKEKQAETINNNLSNHLQEELTEEVEEVTIGEGNQKVSVQLQGLLCIKSEGNYLEVYSIQNNNVERDVIRFSLKKAAQQLSDIAEIHNCHRSYIANFKFVTKVSGNARNYELHISNLDFSIPVSRSFSKELIAIYI
ncbi:LytTR family DNA-binding domain-containing protein [Flammeovirga kamogawensis]|uniref:LytTR family transcriptional regulator n=1 Tax=Flammeovirga kamogawensis TaxID=373891 RepID=A0ABX8GZ51_9BACT|nr:LytTR family DNA-binding domain-containing protein [Flammeovirga kamogawensis]MBB6459337.1 hypothetical protein [Flammeovirga kamogawensis]QWG08896.1 LytTR family transcriptional regulator [Flammeovirga kamogawensis]TRX67186.1 LytTR family transcriptional regulator [Flammeovirga kamogawensis]